MGNKLVSKSNKIIFYQNDQLSAQIEVKVQDETVWLNRRQLSELFDRDIKTIGKHINNALNEELKGISVVANFATTGSDGKKYQVEYYNLDMIISLGFRVKSQRGIHFRIWANSVLKDHMHQGHSINKRILKIADRIDNIENDIHEIKLQLNDQNLPTQGIFFDGQVFDAYVFASDLIRTAKKSLILIDNYIDEETLKLFSKIPGNIKLTFYTSKLGAKNELALKRFQEQFTATEFYLFKRSHDRFMIIDEKDIYHIGASLKDLGKKWFAFTKLDISPALILEKLIHNS